MIAISARIPLLCLGDDGTSKTLSLNLVLSQMQGRFSSKPLLRTMRRVQPFHLQLSESTTAKQIVELKKTVVAWNAGRDAVLESHPCVCLEEMSMAQDGPAGPLRALHDLLDSHQESRARRREDVGTGTNNFSFVSTSNYRSDNARILPTGRALGNRLLVLAHEPLPPMNLIDLAVRTGKGAFGERCESVAHQETCTSMLRSTISALCNESDPHPDHGMRLVPDLISIRSLLYFSRALASLLVENVPLREAQVRAFACHLQLQTAEKSKQVWGRVDKALDWSQSSSALTRPNTVNVVYDALGPAKTKRPLLFLYTSSMDIYQAVNLCTEASEGSLVGTEESDAAARPRRWLICPASQSMVRRQRKAFPPSLQSEVSDSERTSTVSRSSVVEGGHVLHAMVGGWNSHMHTYMHTYMHGCIYINKCHGW
jgi:hypothetical protein